MLVVDDDADGRQLVAATLEHYGAGVMTAASAAEALDLLQTKRVSVLLADIAMRIDVLLITNRWTFLLRSGGQLLFVPKKGARCLGPHFVRALLRANPS